MMLFLAHANHKEASVHSITSTEDLGAFHQVIHTVCLTVYDDGITAERILNLLALTHARFRQDGCQRFISKTSDVQTT